MQPPRGEGRQDENFFMAVLHLQRLQAAWLQFGKCERNHGIVDWFAAVFVIAK